MPTNLYGPADNFDLDTSHVIPALLRKAHEAKIRNECRMVIWGSGTPRREFMHVDNCADALVHVMKFYSAAEHINIGTGEELTIAALARLIADVVGFSGELVFDPSKPGGTPRKLMDGAKLASLGLAFPHPACATVSLKPTRHSRLPHSTPVGAWHSLARRSRVTQLQTKSLRGQALREPSR